MLDDAYVRRRLTEAVQAMTRCESERLTEQSLQASQARWIPPDRELYERAASLAEMALVCTLPDDLGLAGHSPRDQLDLN